MRIVFFIGTLGVGGAERQLVQLSGALANAGHEVTVVTFFPGGANGKALLDRKNVRWISLSNVIVRHKLGRTLLHIQAPWRFKRVLREVKPDVVYSMLHLTNLYAWLVTRGKFSPALVWGYRASRMDLNWKRWLPERVCACVSSTVPLMIANSKAGAEYARSLKGFRPQHLSVVANGIDTEEFYPNPLSRRALRAEIGVKEDEWLVGLVGRIDPIKGHDVFLQAARKILQIRKGFRFVIAGDGRQERIQDLSELAGELDIQDSVLWLGYREDMCAVYNALDILCSPSYGEGFPNVVAEAMACGTPCVVTAVGDSAMIVGRLGRVVPAGDSEALAREICSFEEWSVELSPESLRERILNRFSLDSMECKTEDLLKCVISRNVRRR